MKKKKWKRKISRRRRRRRATRKSRTQFCAFIYLFPSLK